MAQKETLARYQEWIKKCSAYRMALSVLTIDKMTLAPQGGAAFRDERMAILSGELFSIRTDPEIFEIIKNLKDDPDADGDTRRSAQLYYKELENERVIPKDEYVAFSLLVDQGYNDWLKAKKESDYSLFEPTLKKLIEESKKIYGYRSSKAPIYDQMLDDYEPGTSIEFYDKFFDKVKERLIPLIQKVVKAKQVDTSFLYQTYPVDKQKAFMDKLLTYLHFDSSLGYQNETEHPFTDWICENDCRVTTKYLPDNVASAMLSTIHEVGHATYEHDIDPKYDGMILSDGVSCAMHESQSRLCENYLGRTKAFWTSLYPQLQEEFPGQLGSVSIDAFVDALNAAVPSLVRTEADELTYPLHILIRYEIEKGLFNGSLSTEGLNKTWNELYKKYLGVDVPNDREGILQDVHWSDASFGYFPTYALGSAYAAQFVHTMRKDIDVDKLLAQGHYDQVMGWLKEHVHQYGCRLTPQEVMTKATGEPFDPDYYLDYLEDKYTRLYHL